MKSIIHAPHLQPTGLGDVVAKIARPIAKVIDRVAGTKVSSCGGCKARQEALNLVLPDVSNPFSRDTAKAKE